MNGNQETPTVILYDDKGEPLTTEPKSSGDATGIPTWVREQIESSGASSDTKPFDRYDLGLPPAENSNDTDSNILHLPPEKNLKPSDEEASGPTMQDLINEM